MKKTLIGKDNYLFLINDTCRELEVHTNNIVLIKDPRLAHYKKYMNKLFMVIYPNKCLVHKQFLPDEYELKYRPGLDIYKSVFNEQLLDCYEFLENQIDTYYKTDTHINLKGNYLVYIKFIEKINNIFNLNLQAENINIEFKNCILKTIPKGIGDLTWPQNLGDQILDNIDDTYYYSNNILDFYITYVIKNENNIRFLDYKLKDNTLILENETAHWNNVSKYIIYKKNDKKNHKVVIFYDSFLLSILPLYFNLFQEVYLAKCVYNTQLIELINPDYIFEFRVERFLL